MLMMLFKQYLFKKKRKEKEKANLLIYFVLNQVEIIDLEIIYQVNNLNISVDFQHNFELLVVNDIKILLVVFLIVQLFYSIDQYLLEEFLIFYFQINENIRSDPGNIT